MSASRPQIFAEFYPQISKMEYRMGKTLGLSEELPGVQRHRQTSYR